MNEGLCIAVFAPLYPPAFRGGGPIRSIEALVSSAPPGTLPLVFTSNRDIGTSGHLAVEADGWTMSGSGEVYFATADSPIHLWKGLWELRRRRPRLLHFNSFMNPKFTIIPLLLWRIGFWRRAQILLAPRGEFGDGAFRRRTLRKRLYVWVFRLLRIHRSVVWHSTAPHETNDIRRIWGKAARVIERENDTLLSDTALVPSVRSGPLRTVFLGRIVEHKGLALVLTALMDVKTPVRFDVCGAAEDVTYAGRCEALAGSLPAHVEVRFHGAVAADAVVDVLAEHDVLFMPTAGENFGHVIAEALSASCYVVTTPRTPWTQTLLESGGGMTLERNASSWTVAIEQLARDGLDQRLANRIAAGATFDQWRARVRAPHVWSLAVALLGKL